MPKLNLFLKYSVLLLLPLTLLISFKTDAASYNFSLSKTQFISGCRSSVNLMIDATNEESNAADIEFYYNPSEIDLIDSDSNFPGVQIKSGNAYESYFGNVVDSSTGKVLLAGASFTNNLNSKKIFTTIEFVNKPGVTSTSFSIKFDGVGNTKDSNIADASTSNDLLKSVSGGTYTFVPGFCESEAPRFTFVKPAEYANNVALNSNIEIDVTDNLSGVDLSTVEFEVGGKIYNINSPELKYSGTNLNYKFIIDPKDDFSYDSKIDIKAKANDFAGNKGSRNTFFYTIFDCPVSPVTNTEVINSSSNANPVNNITNSTQNITGNSPNSENRYYSSNNLNPDSLLYPNLTLFNAIARPAILNDQILNKLDTSGKVLQLYSLASLAFLFLAIVFILMSSDRMHITGVAIDKATGNIIPSGFIYLFDSLNGYLIDEIKTDEEGNYDFRVKPGAYKLYSKEYSFDENIIISESKFRARFFNKEMDIKNNVNTNKFVAAVRYIFSLLKVTAYKLSPGFTFAGFILSIINVMLVISLLNTFIFVTYLAIYIMIYIVPGVVMHALHAKEKSEQKNNSDK